MKPSKPLGCLSPLALFSAFVTVCVLLLLTGITGGAVFSPGALNAQVGPELGGVTSHAALGSRCAACHAEPWSPENMAQRCLTCHTQIQDEMSAPGSLHGKVGKSARITCHDCHVEHHGAAAGLTSFDAANFPHQETGFSLAEHRFNTGTTPFVCADCHIEQISSFSPAVCGTCHGRLDAAFTTAHRQAFGEDCLACHDGVDRYAAFDHNRVKFALAGAHQPLSCEKCHANARSVRDLQSAPLTCEGCHLAEDAHQGSYGTQCGGCHQPTRWQEATFDHSRSAFALDGAHSKVSCKDCHRDGTYKGTPRECAACHADPAFHLGLFPNQACQTCHTTSSWRPAKYTGKHTFPMDHGEKRSNACADCHQPNLTQWTCYGCHKQAEVTREHQKEGIANFNDCLRCHPTGREDEGEGRGNGKSGD